ncbi:alpha/beta fold hydrolase [Paracoccus aestuariivivens]|uniref:Alpha/beta fold hydrolase n=1 Tax=Paracoccus aestuariivivens TaxID=1820333 RepID=A0A6L6J743_9RHOB|nr:alpha/beta hydrolase [Paracoccus aestuariivivens]MTH77923.1 alpha/beta fold hydrolase [Paracoccus aestuariivivens]
MNAPSAVPSASNAPTRFADIKGRTIAYREIGTGPALILCVRFRGILDSWDPAFLDSLACHFHVITFDYSGLGQSTGSPSYRPERLASDAIDLADALGLRQFIIGGWSLGGIAAQVVAAQIPDRISHVALIGTSPPGRLDPPSEPIFLQTALKPINDLADETILFFEPASASSREAAANSHQRIAARSESRSPAIPPETYLRLLQERAGEDIFADTNGYNTFLANCGIPILVITGDHEIVFPAPNWFALSRVWKSLHLLVLPQMGHGPQHEVPEMAADIIATFVRNRAKQPMA